MRLLLIMVLCLPQLVFAQVNVVASIKPLVFILQEIGGDKIVIEQLIPDQASHHDYPLKMSDHRLLHQADLILWIGADLESFLVRPLANLSREKNLPLMDLPGIVWPQESEAEHHHHHHHDRDPHLWLNPRNVILVVNALTKKLSELDQIHATDFHHNAEIFIQKLKKLDGEIEHQMLPLKDKGFAVYHQGYSHYVERYKLKQLGYLVLTPERKSGAKHLNELLNKLTAEGKCIFAEPFTDDEPIQNIAKEHQLKLGYLDLMGIQSDNYQQMMQSMANSFLACLSDGGR